MAVSVSPQLEALCQLALEHGFDSISDNEGPLVPFTLIEGPEGRELHRHVVGDFELELSVEAAQQSISGRADIATYAIAWDGYVTEPGRKTDAVLVEAGDRDCAVLLAQCYGPLERDAQGTLTRARIGEPLMLGWVESRLGGG
ncbi:MAG: hypothetical protein GQE15_20765 [Archangiaceae bacterium]|nr:hypothetical protein [Archangiaceae bacterium]